MKALQLNPKAMWAHAKWGEALFNLAKVAEGESQFQAAAKISPGNADIYRLWGDALSSSGRTNDAIAKYKKALEINPALLSARIGLSNAEKK